MFNLAMASLRTTIPGQVNESLDHLVRISGTSKATIVREALTALLVERGVLSPDTQPMEPTRTRGRGLASDNKEK